jgi:hypothetical protein
LIVISLLIRNHEEDAEDEAEKQAAALFVIS